MWFLRCKAPLSSTGTRLANTTVLRIATALDALDLVRELEASLQEGDLAISGEKFAGIVARAYREFPAALIVQAAIESGGTVMTAYALYHATLEGGAARLPEWDGQQN